MKTNAKIVKRLLGQHKSTWLGELEQIDLLGHRDLLSVKSYIDGLYDSLHSEDYVVRTVAMAKLKSLK